MGRIGFFGMAACGVATLAMSAGAHAQQDRVSATEKGSLLIYSKIEIRWDSDPAFGGSVIRDTYLTVANDFPEDVRVQFYFINGDSPVDHLGNFQPSWNNYDQGFELTKDQTLAWSAVRGTISDGPSLSPFWNLDPDGRPIDDNNDGVTDYWALRGFAIGFAVNADNQPVRHNHLAGTGMLVDYSDGIAWEYNAWGVQALAGEQGGEAIGDGTLELDGTTYAQVFDTLLMTFHAAGPSAYSEGGFVNTDITLHPVDLDLVRTGQPVATKAEYNVWNENEVKFSGLYRCVTCWDQALAGFYAEAPVTNHLRIMFLGTNFGKARITGEAGFQCNDVDPETGEPIVAQETELLGVRATLMTFGNGDINGFDAAAGTNMFGMGYADATITYAPEGAPEEAPAGAGRDNDPFGINGLIRNVRRDVAGSSSK